jgi:hypothetical protein
MPLPYPSRSATQSGPDQNAKLAPFQNAINTPISTISGVQMRALMATSFRRNTSGGSGGSRTRSIPRFKGGWSAHCLPSQKCSRDGSGTHITLGRAEPLCPLAYPGPAIKTTTARATIQASQSGRQGIRTLTTSRPHSFQDWPGNPYPATFRKSPRFSQGSGGRTHAVPLPKRADYRFPTP